MYKQQQNFQQSWAKKRKTNVSLGGACYFGPAGASSDMGGRLQGEAPLPPCCRPAGLSGTWTVASG